MKHPVILAIMAIAITAIGSPGYTQENPERIQLYDRSIETAAIHKLQEKISDELRGTFDTLEFDSQVAIISPEQENDIPPYVPPKPDTDAPALKPMVSNEALSIPDTDRTLTGSVKKPTHHRKPLTVWERFDSQGNLIHPKW